MWIKNLKTGEVVDIDTPQNMKDCVKLTAKQAKIEYKQYKINKLKEMLENADSNIIWGIVRHVSASRMRRVVSLHVLSNGDLIAITPLISQALGYKYCSNHRGVITGEQGVNVINMVAYDALESCGFDRYSFTVREI